MAVDRAILAAHEAGDAPPTLRLYRWGQPHGLTRPIPEIEDVDLDVCDA